MNPVVDSRLSSPMAMIAIVISPKAEGDSSLANTTSCAVSSSRMEIRAAPSQALPRSILLQTPPGDPMLDMVEPKEKTKPTLELTLYGHPGRQTV